MDTLSYKTKSAKPQEVKHQWFVVDAEGKTLGRLATEIARVLRGKHKPSYTPHVDCGDYVIVLNSEKVHMTGRKIDQKLYVRHSGYPGGQKTTTPRMVLAKHPERVIESAVKGMLPKTRLGRAMFRKLFVYVGDQHKHQAQQPKKLEI
ncbi:MAG: 50S ribosomal protein L13 [Saprospiraceae bacterium]|nr:50S ribosomal protein L13 [Saprospiraceae bacterium]